MKHIEKIQPTVTRFKDQYGKERVKIEMEMSIKKWKEVQAQLNIESYEVGTSLFEDIKEGLNEVQAYYQGKGQRYTSNDL